MNSHMFHHAAEYRDRGYSVIPLRGKSPLAGFPRKQYQEHRPTLDELRRWFGGGNPERYNCGIVTGSVSDLVVVDCDTPAEADSWLREHPETPMRVQTKRGCHFYYRYPSAGKVGCPTYLAGRKLDLRGEGGYAVAPPSVHPKTGRPYVWEPWEHYSFEELPRFDLDWLPAPEASPETSSMSSCRRPRGECPIRDAAAYISRIRAISGQGGHNATYRAAATCRDAGMSEAETMDALRAWNQTNAVPPWSEREILHKVRDVFRAVVQ